MHSSFVNVLSKLLKTILTKIFFSCSSIPKRSLAFSGKSSYGVSDNILTGELDSNKDGILFLSIPYDNNFEIYVDGREVDYYSLLDGTFIGLDIGVGEHDIKLEYVDNNFEKESRIFLKGLILGNKNDFKQSALLQYSRELLTAITTYKNEF